MDTAKIPRSDRPADWAWLDALLCPVDDDFVQATEEPPNPQSEQL